MIASLINSLVVMLSLGTAVGVLVHDMHIDKVAATAVTSPVGNDTGKATNLSPDFHTHTERHSLSHLLGSRVPGVQPRFGEDKRYLLQKHAVRGHHPFDNYNLPII
jgi:hypothetical protein